MNFPGRGHPSYSKDIAVLSLYTVAYARKHARNVLLEGEACLLLCSHSRLTRSTVCTNSFLFYSKGDLRRAVQDYDMDFGLPGKPEVPHGLLGFWRWRAPRRFAERLLHRGGCGVSGFRRRMIIVPCVELLPASVQDRTYHLSAGSPFNRRSGLSWVLSFQLRCAQIADVLSWLDHLECWCTENSVMLCV